MQPCREGVDPWEMWCLLADVAAGLETALKPETGEEVRLCEGAAASPFV